MEGYTVFLDFIDPNIRLHKKNCPLSVLQKDRNARTEGWWKDFNSLEEAREEMTAASKFCKTVNVGPCKICEPF